MPLYLEYVNSLAAGMLGLILVHISGSVVKEMFGQELEVKTTHTIVPIMPLNRDAKKHS